MREIKSHVINPANDKLRLLVLDESRAVGACHHYSIAIPGEGGQQQEVCSIRFQNGPIAEAGVNGVTQEVLLAVVIDRLQSFQAGPFASRENALALTKCEEAVHWLNQRTLERMRRGVEGTHQK